MVAADTCFKPETAYGYGKRYGVNSCINDFQELWADEADNYEREKWIFESGCHYSISVRCPCAGAGGVPETPAGGNLREMRGVSGESERL